MKSYRDYLRREGVPEGPWVTRSSDSGSRRQAETGTGSGPQDRQSGGAERRIAQPFDPKGHPHEQG